MPGPAVDELSHTARDHAIYLVIGVVERDRGTLYCSVLFFGPDGTFLGKHRKIMPTASERLVWGFGDGSTMPVFETPLGRLGAVICWENYLPLMRAAMFAKGIEIYCAPTADPRDSWIASMRHIAVEGRCFVLSCNQLRGRDHSDRRARSRTDRPRQVRPGCGGPLRAAGHLPAPRGRAAPATRDDRRRRAPRPPRARNSRVGLRLPRCGRSL